MQLWIWRNIRVELPEDWELLQYSRNPVNGHCDFADRRQFRFELSWRAIAGAPDFERMLADYRAELERNDLLHDIRLLKIGGWPGLAGRRDGRESSRFGAYFDPPGHLVELVFLWPGARDKRLESDVLAACRPEPPGADGRRRWKAFGMDWLAPNDSELTACAVEPARVSLTFTGERKPERLTVQRIGLLRQWLKQPPAEWFRRQIPDRVRQLRLAETRRAGHVVHLAEGWFVPQSVLQRRGHYAGAAWICPGDQRVYRIEQISHRQATPRPAVEALPGGVLTCCRALGALA